MSPTPDDVIAFWFEPPATSGDELMAKIRRWFMGGPELDGEITERFGDAVAEATDGGLEQWAETPRGVLALVLLLDQMTRNVFRDTPRMYAGDARAQRLAGEAFAGGAAGELAFVEQLFLSMPLLHSEDLAHHDQLDAIIDELEPRTPPLYAKMAGMHREQANKYRGVLERFGRYPHRNEILGRETTAEEAEFLVDWRDKAPPRGAPRPE